jgi:hypothetical protein
MLDGCTMASEIRDAAGSFAEQSRAEHDAGEDLAHDLRLAKSRES